MAAGRRTWIECSFNPLDRLGASASLTVSFALSQVIHNFTHLFFYVIMLLQEEYR